MSWDNFKYQPVTGWFERVQRRILRAQRRVMLRSFIERGFDQLALRMKTLRDNARLHGDRKMAQFRRVLDDYAKLVTAGKTAPAGSETAHSVA